MRTSSIRMATLDDIEMLCGLVSQYLPQTPYGNMEPDLKTTAIWIRQLITGGVIIIADEDSFIGGATFQPPFSAETVAAEIMWGSLKKGIQRPKVEKQLLEAFEYWARNIIKADAIQIGSFHGDKFLTKRGYDRCETLYLARLT